MRPIHPALGLPNARRAALAALMLVATGLVWLSPQRAAAGPECGVDQDAVLASCQQPVKWTAAQATPGLKPKTLTLSGQRVFSGGGSSAVAHDATTGTKLWQAQLLGTKAENPPAVPLEDLAASRDGSRVYLVGDDVSPTGVTTRDTDLIIESRDGATGAVIWRRVVGLKGIVENDRIESIEQASAISVSPDGRRVYAAGTRVLRDRLIGQPIGREAVITYDDVVVVALDATTGQVVWTKTAGNPYWVESVDRIVVSPDNRRVYVGGESRSCASCLPDFLTAGFRADHPEAPAQEGALLWLSRYDGFGGYEIFWSAAVSPDGAHVFVTGSSGGDAGGTAAYDWATLAYRTSDGQLAWVARYDGPSGQLHPALSAKNASQSAFSVETSPDGNRVYVHGTAALAGVTVNGVTSSVISAPTTIAYDAATGQQAWIRHDKGGPGGVMDSGGGRWMDLAADGSTLYVAGASGVAALDTAAGARKWLSREPGDAVVVDGSLVVAATSDGTLRAYDAQPGGGAA